ncbi:LysR family transcriptional regulator [Spartinivicinus poritis]|uniref:LysR family transcriptional regulator n=1 Tax=Spartinivicinus poritis TaxID=2994640 RepID=A0ABT5U369_9GAMM|nr:LysR family transcriptional regulator [Spartinivicinus sp. A2-2]MDE1460803.1 LysR family transcriptional regulator [Spartinivicinus sp. A2-2]
MKSRLHVHVGTLRQLEILLAVHDHGGISDAAKALYLTQPTVSMQMKKLSEAIGVPLYNISHRKVVFTDEGLALVKTAVEVLDSFARLDMSLSNMRELKSGTLRLSVVNTSQYFIPHLLGPFCEHYPGVEIQLKVGNREQTMERLKRGVDDFYVFSHPPQDTDTESIEFLDNPLVAIAYEGHPLANKKHLTLKDFRDEAFLIREQGSGTRHAVEAFLRKHNMQLNIKMTIESNEAIKHLVMSKLGISILSAHTLTYGGQSGLIKLPVHELPIDSHWFFVWSKSKRQTLIAQKFLQYVEKEGRNILHTELSRN